MASDPAPAARPLSPHLFIYKRQITAVLSIIHRLTGIALTAGSVLLVWWLAALASGPAAFAAVQSVLGSWLGLLVLLGWSTSLIYHLLNGIRHLFWDMGYGYALRTVTASGIAVVIGTAVLTMLVWAAGLATWAGRP